jgi:hypothetical protein
MGDAMVMDEGVAPFLALISERFDLIVQECARVIPSTPLWRETDIYEGSWQLFVFYDYEAEDMDGIAENLARCPETASVLQSIPGRRAASFSALGPRSRIKPHAGLDNGLLRLHCGLRIPTGCTLGTMNDHPGLTLGNVRSVPALFGALQHPLRHLATLSSYFPEGVLSTLGAVTTAGEATAPLVATALEGVNRLIDDITFVCHAQALFPDLKARQITADWLRILETEGVLHWRNNLAPEIRLSYPSQKDLVRWLNTAIVADVLFPDVFAKELTWNRRVLAEGVSFIFNDAFLHDAHNDSSEVRVALLVDFVR